VGRKATRARVENIVQEGERACLGARWRRGVED
jgi:hypothetical protein